MQLMTRVTRSRLRYLYLPSAERYFNYHIVFVFALAERKNKNDLIRKHHAAAG
jgi:hypothetical protein